MASKPEVFRRRELKREAGLFGLLFANVGGIIGSGWMFAPLQAAKAAGPAALLAWIVGGAAVLSVAFVYAELAAAFPRAGAVIAFPKLSHGEFLATIMSWFALLGYAASAPAEATAVVSYAANYAPALTNSAGRLSWTGFAAGIGLLAVFALVNMMAIGLVLRVNNLITACKIVIPVLTIFAFAFARFHASNFVSLGFAPAGGAGVLAALAGSGVVYAYTGFDQAIELAAESRNPTRDLPIAIVGSVLIGIVVYLGVQIAFIGALSPADLAHGWSNVRFAGVAGPFAGLAALAGMTWLAALLYADSVVSPSGTGILIFTVTSRMVFAVGREGLGGRRFEFLSEKGVPIIGLLATYAAGVLFLLPLPSWTAIVRIVSDAALVSYGMTCLSLITLRWSVPTKQFKRPFQLYPATPIALFAFTVVDAIVVWTGKLTVDIVSGFVFGAIVLYCAVGSLRGRRLADLSWGNVWWTAPWFGGLCLFANIGPRDLTHGAGLLSPTGLLVGLVAFSLAIATLAVRCGLRDASEAKASLKETQV